jgi:cytochrome c biogenesis protein CcdA
MFQLLGLALWAGIQTSISPCPLATNIAAITFLGRRVESGFLVFLGGVLYTIGRTLAYTLLTILLLKTALQRAEVSLFLQSRMYEILGPVLLFIGMLLLGLIPLHFGTGRFSDQIQKHVHGLGIWGAFLLGILFALSFCPTSAGLFFAALALAKSGDSLILVPVVYGIGTGLPVIGFALLIAYSAQSVGKTFHILTQVEWWVRNIAGWIFIVLGIWMSLGNIFEIGWVEHLSRTLWSWVF